MTSTTLDLPRVHPTTTDVVERPPSRLAQIVARERASMFSSRLFAVGIVAFALVIAFAIAK